MKKFNSKRQPGFSILEIIISLFVFISIISVVVFLSFESQESFIKSQIFQEIIFESQNVSTQTKLKNWNDIYSFEIEEEGFKKNQEVSFLYDYSKMVSQETSWLKYKNLNPAKIVSVVSDWSKSIGGDTCSNNIFDFKNFSIISEFDLGFSGASDIDVVRGTAYVSFNSSGQSDPDILVLDVKDAEDVKLISSLNTGPGINSVQAAGQYIFLANDSVTNQLQIVDVLEIENPKLITQYRLLDNSSTTIPHRIFYKDKKIFLGMKGHNIGKEFHVMDVSNIYLPEELSSGEVGTQVNDITIRDNYAFLAVPNPRPLRIFDLEKMEEIFSYETGGNSKHGGQSLSIRDNLLTLSRSVGLVNSSYPELFIFDISTPSETIFLDLKNIKGSIRAVLMKRENILVANLKDGEELRVFLVSEDGEFAGSNTLDDFHYRPITLDCDSETIYILVEGVTNKLVILKDE